MDAHEICKSFTNRETAEHRGGELSPTLRHAVDYWAEREPEKIAYIDAAKERTYTQMAAYVEAMQKALLFAGVKREDRIVTALPAGMTFAVLLFSAMRIGANLIPFDLLLSEADVRRRLDIVKPRIVLASAGSHLQQAIDEGYPAVSVGMSHDACDLLADFLAQAEGTTLSGFQEASQDEAVLTIFTSGSTGDPKGVLLSETALIHANSCIKLSTSVTHDDVLLTALPMSHIYGVNAGILLPMLVGATSVLEVKFRADAMLDAVRAVNPSIVYCSLSGYGQTGPYVNMPGHDINYLSLAGVLDTIGCEGGNPTLPGIQIADLGGGSQWAMIAILLALMAREKDGRGRYLDISMTRCVVPWMTLYLSQYAADGTVPARGSTKAGGHYACYRIYQTSDGRSVSIGAAEPKFWARFCEVVGKPELVADQYAEGERRLELISELEEMFKADTQQHWVDLLMNENVCFTPVRSFDEVVDDGGIVGGDLVGAYEHPVEGGVLNIGFPVDIPGIDMGETKPAPRYGADTAYYRAMVGLGDATPESHFGSMEA